MDASIVKDFQRLRVLASYDPQRMDELVQDLTNALEETSRSPLPSRSSDQLQPQSGGTLRRNCKKRRGRKRRPNSACTSRYDGGNFSEASESSVEEAALSQELRENATTTTTHQSDSDDTATAMAVASGRLQGPLPKLACVLSLAESDSVTENFSPLRPHRRRRKFKRMSTDPPAQSEVCEGPMTSICSHKPPVSGMKPRLKTLEVKNDNVMDEYDMDAEDLPSGKRKRKGSSKDSERLAGTSSHLSAKMDVASNSQESSSSFSSSESDCGIFTNDEARDGDDEQSDFFHEPGPACGVPGIIPWWESAPGEPPLTPDEAAHEAAFKSILTGSFELMSASAKAGFKARINKMGREIRRGRRRLKPERFGSVPLRKQKSEMTGLSMDKLTLWHGCNGVSATSDTKRRKQTPPDSPSEPPSGYVGEHAAPIPESNIGNRMLQTMGWTPGSGLGISGTGITQPILAFRRAKRKGFGASDQS